MKKEIRFAAIRQHGELLFWAALILLGLFAFLLMSYLTPFGMGLVNDSVAYIAGARNVTAGLGYSRISGDGSPLPITHFPPLFSMTLIATTALTGLETIRAARLVNLLLFGGNVILTGIAARKITSSKVLAILAAVTFLISEPFLRVHSFALSEPLFLFLSYLALLTLAHYFGPRTMARNQWVWLAAAGFFCGLGYITRYIGVALYAAAATSILFLSAGWKKRINEGLVFLAFGLPVPLAWSLRNLSISGNAANRPFEWHPPDQERIYEGVNNLWGWLLPDGVGPLTARLPKLELATYILLGLIFIGLCATTWQYLFRQKRVQAAVTVNGTLSQKAGQWMKGRIEFSLVFGWYGLIYLFLLVFAMTFFDSATTFEHRMLAPFYVSLLMIGIGLISLLWKRPNKAWKLTASLLCLAMLGTITMDSIHTVNELHDAGQGFASGRWRNSETMEAVRHLPPCKIFSNKITGLYLLANRPAYVIPWRFVPDLSQPDPTFDDGVAEYRRQVLNKEAVVVIFDYETAIREGDIRVINLTQGLPIMGMYPDGVIFGVLEFVE